MGSEQDSVLIKELPLEYKGRGSMKGFTFRQVDMKVDSETDKGMYIYEVTGEYGAKHWEVFERRINKRFNVVSYPGDESFGFWAKCCRSYERARQYYDGGITVTL